MKRLNRTRVLTGLAALSIAFTVAVASLWADEPAPGRLARQRAQQAPDTTGSAAVPAIDDRVLARGLDGLARTDLAPQASPNGAAPEQKNVVLEQRLLFGQYSKVEDRIQRVLQAKDDYKNADPSLPQGVELMAATGLATAISVILDAEGRAERAGPSQSLSASTDFDGQLGFLQNNARYVFDRSEFPEFAELQERWFARMDADDAALAALHSKELPADLVSRIDARFEEALSILNQL